MQCKESLKIDNLASSGTAGWLKPSLLLLPDNGSLNLWEVRFPAIVAALTSGDGAWQVKGN